MNSRSEDADHYLSRHSQSAGNRVQWTWQCQPRRHITIPSARFANFGTIRAGWREARVGNCTAALRSQLPAFAFALNCSSAGRAARVAAAGGGGVAAVIYCFVLLVINGGGVRHGMARARLREYGSQCLFRVGRTLCRDGAIPW